MQTSGNKKTLIMASSIVILLMCLTQIWAGPQIGPRIIGGELARDGQYPFAVGIYYITDANIHFCSGSILSDRWILTAAHCLWGGVQFRIYFGVNNLSQALLSGNILISEEYIKYPDNIEGSLQHDIGLIPLSTPLTFNARVQRIKLPTAPIDAFQETIALGWGGTTNGAEFGSDELYHVPLTTISNAVCIRTYGQQITETMVCAIGRQNQGICDGDSGGPLIQIGSDGKPTQVGVTSFYSSAGCETAHPSGFIRTFEYVEWIKNVTGVDVTEDTSASSTVVVNLISLVVIVLSHFL